MLDLLVRGACIVTPGGIGRYDIGSRDGKIAFVGDASATVEAETVIEAGGLHLFPGIIDGHVHLRDPSPNADASREDFGTGTAAAARGGITTVVDMPNTFRPPVDGHSLQTKLESVKLKAHIDYAFTGLIQAATTDQDLASLVNGGAIGFNVFNDVEVYGCAPPEEGRLWAILTDAARYKLPVGMLSESMSMVRAARAALDGANAISIWREARTEAAEVQAVAKSVTLGSLTGARIHINHLSSGRALRLVQQAKAEGAAVTCETCPHQLLMTRGGIGSGDLLARVSPPLRSRDDCEALWRGVIDGNIDLVVSDHAPHEGQQAERPDLWEPAVTGYSGVELIVPLLLSTVANGRISLEQFACLMSARPAKFFGLYPNKGTLLSGADADFTLCDLAHEREVRPEELISRGKFTPFAGCRLSGWPRFTIVRGSVVMAEGDVVGSPGHGQYVTNVQARVRAIEGDRL